jgi:PleD family two-component response regulator
MGMRERARHFGGVIDIESQIGLGARLSACACRYKMNSKPIRVLLGDDHRIVREGLKQMLADAPDIEVCAEATNGPDVLDAVQAPGRRKG